MGDLILFLDEIKLFLDGRILLVSVFPYLEKNLDHILGSLVDIGFVEDISELIVNCIGNCGIHLFQKLPNLSGDTNRYLDTIIGRFVQEEEEDLSDEDLVDNLLVDEMRKEHGGCDGDRLVISLERLPELHNKTADEQVANLRQFCVHDCHHGGINGGEGQTRGLCLHDGSAKQPPATDEVLPKKLRNNLLDVCDIAFVDHALYGFLQGFPCHPLKLGAGFVLDGSLHGSQPRRRNIGATSTRLRIVDGQLPGGAEGVLEQLHSRIVFVGRRISRRLPSVLATTRLAICFPPPVATRVSILGWTVTSKTFGRAGFEWGAVALPGRFWSGFWGIGFWRWDTDSGGDLHDGERGGQTSPNRGRKKGRPCIVRRVQAGGWC